MEIFNFFCGLATIIGAIFTYKQYKKADNAAKSAMKARDDIYIIHSTFEVRDLLPAAKRIEKILVNYTSKKDINFEGLNTEKDAKLIQFFMLDFNRIRVVVPGGSFRSFLDQTYNASNRLASNFNNLSFKERVRLLDNIKQFTARASEEVNNRKFGISSSSS